MEKYLLLSKRSEAHHNIGKRCNKICWHFGTYTFFLSGSAADFHWQELVAKQYGEHYSLDYVKNHMDKKTKRNWHARNLFTVARHIDFIFRK
jgi:hypothetical protein